MSNIIGIDFGTTNCCVAVVKNGNAEVIPNRSGNRITPTLVTFIKSGETLIGEKAAQYAVKNSKQTVVSVKRYIGKDRPFFNGTEMYSPIEISAIVLRELRRNAEDYLGETVTEAVVTVPAYYNDLQRQATKDAAGIAGLNVVKMINEPTSAALAYSLDHSVLQRVLVFDLGGGTFDVSVIEIRSGIVEVLATNGDNRLGGDDFDERLVEHFLELIHRERRFSIRRHPDALFRLIEAARTAKEILSSEESYAISVPVLTSGRHMFDFEYTLTRKKFNELCADLFDRLEEPVQDVLVDAQLAASELDKVILVGGSTHIPAVQDKIKELTGLTPLTDIDPDECVAIGAAIQGFALLQAHEGRNDVDLPLLIDVISQSLSIETAGGIATKIVERNSVLPIRCTKVFSLPNTNRKGVELNILQGEHPIAKHNVSIGRIRLEDICSETPGEKRIEVTFNIDTNGILNIKARDPDTGNEQSVTISGRLQMSSTGVKRSINHINHTITATK